MQENSINMKELEQQIKAYEKIKGVFEVFAKVLEAVLFRAVKDLGLPAIVQARAKDIPSFAEKGIRKQKEYPDPMNEFTDLCGARVILNQKDGVEPVCDFIRKHFELHEAEDLLERLAVGEFGYRSVHFIVSLKRGAFQNVIEQMGKSKSFMKSLDRLYEKRTEEECEKNKLSPGPKFKAEIQVRTLLQHAWAEFAHDQIYKSEFEVPQAWQRDTNRIAATLEEADNAIARTIKGVKAFKTYFGAYMTPEYRKLEIKKLEAVLRYDPQNMRLAHESARLAMSLELWETAENVLRPFVSEWESSFKSAKLMEASEVIRIRESRSRDEVELAELELERLRDRELSEVLVDFGWAKWKRGKSEGRYCIKCAIALNPWNMDARVALADTYVDEKNLNEALECYEDAYKTAPSDPRALGCLVQCKLILERSLEFIPMIRPSLETGIAKCRERAKVKVYLPQAYYDIGLFGLLLDRPYESLTAYCKAVQLSDSESDIDRTLDWVRKLQVVKDRLPELDWVQRFLLVAKVAKLLKLATITRANEHAKWKALEAIKDKLETLKGQTDSGWDQQDLEEAEAQSVKAQSEFEEARAAAKAALSNAEISQRECLGDIMTPDLPTFEGQVVLVAGGCDKSVEDKMQEYRSLFQKAFKDFHGTVFCGGTTAGISGLVGDLISPEKEFVRKIAYFPRSIPAWTKIHDEYDVYYTAGSGFSALETLQMWTDILASGIDPADVKLLGINGGKISAFEFRLALTLGAKVGIIRSSGRAASEIFEDTDWNEIPGLLSLPNDRHTIKRFVQDPPCSKVLRHQDRERMAMYSHEDYQQSQKKRHESIDPAMIDWDDLLPDLKQSSLQQIDHIEEKLRAVGFAIRRVETGLIRMAEFSQEEIEVMAEMEHARWNVERLLAGWSLGPRDVIRRKSPYLLSWAELADEVKEWDRQAVRRIPGLLKEYGYEVFRK